MSNRIVLAPYGRLSPKGDVGPAGAGVSTLEPRIDALESASTYKNIYVSQTGNDSNPGTSSAPIQTWEKLLDLLLPGSQNYIYVAGDLDINYYKFLHAAPSMVRFLQYSGQASARLVAKEHTNQPGFTGMWMAGSWVCRIDIPVHLDAISTYGVINSNISQHVSTYYAGGAPTKTTSSTCNMFYQGAGGKLNVFTSNSPISNIAGFVFSGIAAGIDPETNKYITTNISGG